MAVGCKDVFFPTQGADQHEEGRLRQVEVGEQCADDLKFVSGIDKQVGFAGTRADYPLSLLCGVFECADRRRPDCYQAAILAPCPVDLFCGFRGDRIAFRMQFVLFDFFYANRLKGSQPDVECDFGGFDFALAEAHQNLRSEMKTGGGSGDRSALAGIDGLIAVAVGGGILAGNIGWEGDVADALDDGKEVVEGLAGFARLSPHVRGSETDVALAEVSARDDFGMELIVLTEKEVLADGDLASGTDEAFPVVRILPELAGQKDLDASVKEVPRSRIMWAEGLGFKTCAAAIEAGGEHAGIVEDDEVAGPEEIGEFAKLAALEGASLSREVQKTGGSAVRKRLLGD